MSLLALQLEAEEFMADQVVLEERIEHLQKDVGEMRTDLRRLDAKVDGVRDEVAALRTWTAEKISDSATTLRSEIHSATAELRKEIKDTTAELRKEIKDTTGELRKEIKDTTGELRKEFQDTNSEVRNDITRLSKEIGNIHTTIARTTGELRAQFKEDIGNLRWQLIVWSVGTMITGIGVASGIAFSVAKLMQPALPIAAPLPQPAALGEAVLGEEVRPEENPAALAAK